MQNTAIVKVTEKDIERLQEISTQTFIETFAAGNSGDNMEKYLKEGFAYKKLSGEVGNPETEFYFAMHDDKIIGYLKLNFGRAQTEQDSLDAEEIERIYVLKEYWGKKFGSVLLDKSIEIARAKNAPYIWLGVWEHNIRALEFYRKYGFVEFGAHAFKLGDDVQKDILMKKPL